MWPVRGSWFGSGSLQRQHMLCAPCSLSLARVGPQLEPELQGEGKQQWWWWGRAVWRKGQGRTEIMWTVTVALTVPRLGVAADAPHLPNWYSNLR